MVTAAQERRAGERIVLWTRNLLIVFAVLTCGWYAGAGTARLAGWGWIPPWPAWFLLPWGLIPIVSTALTWPRHRRVPDSTRMPAYGAFFIPMFCGLYGVWSAWVLGVLGLVLLLVRWLASR